MLKANFLIRGCLDWKKKKTNLVNRGTQVHSHHSALSTLTEWCGCHSTPHSLWVVFLVGSSPSLKFWELPSRPAVLSGSCAYSSWGWQQKRQILFSWRRKQRKELGCQFPIICQQVRLVEIFLSQQCDLLSGAHLASLPQSRADGPFVVYPLSDDWAAVTCNLWPWTERPWGREYEDRVATHLVKLPQSSRVPHMVCESSNFRCRHSHITAGAAIYVNYTTAKCEPLVVCIGINI